jgi:Domain of unknown function (DUF1929)
MRPPRRGGRQLAVLTAATLVVGGFGAWAAPAAFAADPAQVGSWSKPFEEGGAGTPRCEYYKDGVEAKRLQCKPTAVTSAVLPDGRVLYGNGIESQENAETGSIPSLAPASRDDRTRLLDLRDGSPKWSIPENETSDGKNPNIVKGRDENACLAQKPLGVAGVPGEPGDGLVGSTVGQAAPAKGTCSPDDVEENDGAIFCGDIAQMADGRQLLAGGTDYYNEPAILNKAKGHPVDFGVLELEGLRSARIFDWQQDAWHATSPMKYGRWYPTLVTMPDSSVLAFSGTLKLIKSTQGSQVRRTESYDPGSGKWSDAFSGPMSEKTLPQNSRLYLTPNGKVFYTGHGQMWGPLGQAVDEALYGVQAFFNPKNKQWENAGFTLSRSSPASVMLPMEAPYDTMKILNVGGTFGPPPGTYLATPTSEITTIKGDAVTNKPGPLTSVPRWFSQGTLLPTGEVLLTSGAKNDEVVLPGAEIPVKTPEIYNPESNKFTAMAEPERGRTYHNNAVLLPDGTVLVGGGSPISSGYGMQRDLVPGVTANNDKDSSFEIFTPPYLHKGDRPYIDSVQRGLAWGDNFKIETGDAKEVSRVTMIRMPAPQHVHDSDQRTLVLPFKAGDGELDAEAPPNANVAPPGYYYLFVNKKAEDGSYIPSVARIVHLGNKSDHDEADEPMKDGKHFKGNGATPTETNTYLNNPPNPVKPPTIPGQPDPLGVPLPGPGGPALPNGLPAGPPAHGPSGRRTGRPGGTPRCTG